MLSLCYFIPFTTCLFALSFGGPINYGHNVGQSLRKGTTKVVTAQTLYPYLVDIKIKVIHANLKTSESYCTGVIIGKNAVLTAAHCLRDLTDPTIIVHAGIVDVELEKFMGQQLVVKDYILHKGFQNRCPIEKDRCCYLPNDIAIMWTYKEFSFGPTIKAATLNLNKSKPAGKTGWILGWGDNNSDKRFSMLQKGLVEVMSEEECENFNPYIYVPQTVLCVKSLKGRRTMTADGDSGGPFVMNGVVHGICSQTYLSASCRGKSIDTYTDVARYSTWISRNLDRGPPKHR